MEKNQLPSQEEINAELENNAQGILAMLLDGLIRYWLF